MDKVISESGDASRQLRAQLEGNLIKLEEQSIKDEHNRLELIAHLKDQLFQAKQQGKQDARYARALYTAKNTHNYLELQNKNELAKLRIKAVEVEMSRDKLAHNNIEQWSQLCYEEIQKKIEGWKDKFLSDEAEIVNRIKMTQENIRAQQAMIVEINKTIADKMEEMGPWLAEKEASRLEKLGQLQRNYAAKKIQRWWREYMVKHNIYKRAGKKGKGKKGNGSIEEDRASEKSAKSTKSSRSLLLGKSRPQLLRARAFDKKSPSPAKSDRS